VYNLGFIANPYLVVVVAEGGLQAGDHRRSFVQGLADNDDAPRCRIRGRVLEKVVAFKGTNTG
jgi:hypothetical protein